MARIKRTQDSEERPASPFVIEGPTPRIVIEPMEPTEPTEPTEPMEPTEPIEPTQAMEPGGVEELRDRLVDLQSTVSELLARAEVTPEPPVDSPVPATLTSSGPSGPPGPPGHRESEMVEPPNESASPRSASSGPPGSSESPGSLSGDPEIDLAGRTLRFARQTADAAVAEAREHALAIVADAERQRGEIIRQAHQQADLDRSSERERLARANAEVQAQRLEVIEQLELLSGVLARHREEADELDAGVSSMLARLRAGLAAGPTAPEEEVVDLTTTGRAEAGGRPAPASESVAPEPAESRRRNPFTRQPVGRVATVDALSDPFMFNVEDLPATTGDFGWETDVPANGPTDGPADGPTDGATTF